MVQGEGFAEQFRWVDAHIEFLREDYEYEYERWMYARMLWVERERVEMRVGWYNCWLIGRGGDCNLIEF